MEIRQDIVTTFTSSFGSTRTGKTVVAAILDEDGIAKAGGYTLGSVVELGKGFYSIKITFTAEFSGFIHWDNTTDSSELYDPFVVTNDLTRSRKILTNRWLIESNQLKFYDDDDSTVLVTFDLKKVTAANDGTAPDERVPA